MADDIVPMYPRPIGDGELAEVKGALRTAQAEAAALREALDATYEAFRDSGSRPHRAVADSLASAALATDAGKALLGRLEDSERGRRNWERKALGNEATMIRFERENAALRERLATAERETVTRREQSLKYLEDARHWHTQVETLQVERDALRERLATAEREKELEQGKVAMLDTGLRMLRAQVETLTKELETARETHADDLATLDTQIETLAKERDETVALAKEVAVKDGALIRDLRTRLTEAEGLLRWVRERKGTIDEATLDAFLSSRPGGSHG